MPLVKVAQKNKVPQGGGIAVEVAGKSIALFNLGGEIFAIDDVCTHAGGSLSEGSVEGGVVTCPWHAATFNIKTGEALSPPAFEAVSTYKVAVEGDDIKIEV